MVVVAICSLPFLYLFARRPILRRLALRNIARRPRETVLVILGALLGTAIMTGSFVVGDTFTSSIRRGAFEQLGPIDEVVSVGHPADAGALRARLNGFTHPDVDGVLPLTFVSAAVATTTAPRRAAPSSQLLETDFAAAGRFGGDAHATGISGATPAAGEAAIGTDLVRVLRVGVGDRIDVFAYGVSQRLRVVPDPPEAGRRRLLAGRRAHVQQRVRCSGNDRVTARARYARARCSTAIGRGGLESRRGRGRARSSPTR